MAKRKRPLTKKEQELYALKDQIRCPHCGEKPTWHRDAFLFGTCFFCHRCCIRFLAPDSEDEDDDQ